MLRSPVCVINKNKKKKCPHNKVAHASSERQHLLKPSQLFLALGVEANIEVLLFYRAGSFQVCHHTSSTSDLLLSNRDLTNP